MPKLEMIILNGNQIGTRGVTALIPSLRKLPALKRLHLTCCSIDDEGVSSLLANVGKDDFKALEELNLINNDITDNGFSILVQAIDGGGMPSIRHLLVGNNSASAGARQAVNDAVASRAIARKKA